VTNQDRNVCAVSDLAANACRRRESLRKFPFDTVRTHPYVERGPRGTGRATLAFLPTRSGLKRLQNVRYPVAYVKNCSSLPDSFKDETNQTASEYHVVPTASNKSLSRSPSEARSTSSSTMDPSLPGSSTKLPFYLTESKAGIRSNSANSPRSSSTTPGQPRLASVTEAFLLRHFQIHLAPWVSTFPSNRRHSF